MTPSKVLVVDDQRSARDLLARLLDPARFVTLAAADVATAETMVRGERPDVVVTDLAMPGLDGIEGLKRFRAVDPDLPVIIVTAFATVETAVAAMKLGAFDYVRKPFEAGELEVLLERAVEHRRLVEENRRLRAEVQAKFTRDGVVCRSPAMARVMDLVARVAPTDIALLIEGESGTGKDVFARRIHYSSPRAGKRFVSLNASAIPDHLLESELFGYEKGAFSGAVASHVGFCAEADGGTFFLDEIGDLSPQLQPKLLRVLQDGEFYPVGSRRLAKVDIRLVCATNRDLEALVKDGRFREDLYYRINTVRIVLPPLRERAGDIPLLVEHFLAQARKRNPRAPARVAPSAMRLLDGYRWPGNVRELEHVVESAAVVCDGDEIRPGDLPRELRAAVEEAATEPSASGGYRAARDEFERAYFTRLLVETRGNVQHAAQVAGVHRTTLYEKLARLGLHCERE